MAVKNAFGMTIRGSETQPDACSSCFLQRSSAPGMRHLRVEGTPSVDDRQTWPEAHGAKALHSELNLISERFLRPSQPFLVSFTWAVGHIEISDAV